MSHCFYLVFIDAADKADSTAEEGGTRQESTRPPFLPSLNLPELPFENPFNFSNTRPTIVATKTVYVEVY